MKMTKLIFAMASVMMLASCGGNTPASTSTPSSESSATSEAKTMAFLNDGQLYVDVPNDVLETTDEHVPAIKINGMSVNGGRTMNIGTKVELVAEGTFLHDVYVVVAKSESQGHIAAHVYGALEKENLNEAFSIVATAIGTPNKLYISFTTRKNTWVKNLDAEMDREIEAAWGLLGE